MQDPVRHVVIDANVLSAALLAQSTESEGVRGRAGALLDAVVKARWPGLVLYTPGICVAEVRAIFDKYRYCTWYGEPKTESARRINNDEYWSAQERLQDVEESVGFHRVDHDPAHVLAAGLVSPINAFFQDCGQGDARPVARQPMSATDCVIAGMAIALQRQLGADAVVLATADQRLSEVIGKAKRLTGEDAEQLGLDHVAVHLRFGRWHTDIYPRCVNLIHAHDTELREALLGWPLPTAPLSERTASNLSRSEKAQLAQLWRQVQKEHKLGGEDSLPYSAALDDLRARFACESGSYLANDQIYRVLQNMRKASEMPPEDEGDTGEAGDEPTLFD
jgi:hypothetical protein